MFKFLKRLFPEETKSEEVSLSQLENWLDKEALSLSLNNYLKEYFRQVQSLKEQLKEKVQTLSRQQIADKDREQVEGRIQNIVLGHKEHYVLEVERFLNELLLPEKDHQNIEDFREAREFNNRLNIRLDQLAKTTGKSYQAAQHLFFDQVEPVFKTLGETNSLVKDFPGSKVENLIKIKELAAQLKGGREKRDKLTNSIKETEEKTIRLKKEKEESEKDLKALKEGDSFAEYNHLRKNLEKLKEQFNQVENEIHSFFSKLLKPLKKYERIAIDNQPILPYLEDSLEAFWEDKQLKINEVLPGLKKSLLGKHLEFAQRQKDNFLALIKRSEQGYLQELRKRGEWLREEERRTKVEMNSMVIVVEIKKVEEAIEGFAQRIIAGEKEIEELKAKREKADFRRAEEEFSGKVKEVFNKEIILGKF